MNGLSSAKKSCSLSDGEGFSVYVLSNISVQWGLECVEIANSEWLRYAASAGQSL